MKIKVEKEGTLIDILADYFTDRPKTRLKKSIRMGCVQCGGALLKHPEAIVQKGSILEYKKYEAKQDRKEKAPFKVLYEDEECLAVYKPAGVVSIGRTTEKTRSVLGMVRYYIRQQNREAKIYALHRLEREVPGILLFAKSAFSQSYLQNRWDKVEQSYYVIVLGRLEQKSGKVATWVKENAHKQLYVAQEGEPGAQWAETFYEEVKYYEEEDLSWVRVRTSVYRKHLIRMHLSYIGHPVYGDRKYGDESIIAPIAMLAYTMSFPHPKTQRKIKIEIPVPVHFLPQSKS